MRYLRFAGKFILGMIAVGLAFDLVMRFVVVPIQARERLAQRIPPVRLENAEVGPALQKLADSTHPSLHFSMCPDVASSRVSVTTSEMPFKDFAVLLAAKVGAEVDFARPRHVQHTVPFPHLYFARSVCGVRSFVYVHDHRN
jgi:hypothetical protein